MSDLRKIAALWPKTSKNGTTFYSGAFDIEAVRAALTAGETGLLMFPVKTKRERGPDLELFVAPERTSPAAPGTPTARTAQPAAAQAAEPALTDDDSPF